MKQFTPGPWEAYNDQPKTGLASEPKFTKQYWHVHAPVYNKSDRYHKLGRRVNDSAGIANVFQYTECPDCGNKMVAGQVYQDEAEANAYLIAAAPDLFAACEAVLVNPGVKEIHEMLKAVRKAKGLL